MWYLSALDLCQENILVKYEKEVQSTQKLLEIHNEHLQLPEIYDLCHEWNKKPSAQNKETFHAKRATFKYLFY